MHLVQKDEFLWSKNKLASELGIDRRTVDKYTASVLPAGTKAGNPVWRLRDVVVPLSAALSGWPYDSESGIDPNKLTDPRERRDWYESELKRINYEERMGQLCEADKVAARFAESYKHIALSLDTMVDVIERDAGLNPEQIQIMQRIIDGTREKMYRKVVGEDE